MIKGFLTVSGWTLLSRVLGFVRDILIARFLGTGAAAEAFFVAFSLPNMFRRFFAEGAFNMAFVPLYAKKLEDASEDADAFARDAVALMVVVLTVFTVLGILFMPALVFAMASGFADDGRFSLAVSYGRIAFPYILLISLAALVSGVLNANRRFLAAAAAPALLNIAFISALLLVWAFPGLVPMATPVPSLIYGQALVWTVPLGGALQLGLVWWAARRAGHRLMPRHLPRLTPDLKRLAIIAAPAALAGGVVQVNLLVGRQVASYFDGAVAWLSYADRLYQLPLGVVGIAIGVVLLPDLSRRVRAEDREGQRHALSRATEFALLLTIPAAVALLVVPGTLVSVLFERGAFDADDTASTAVALMVYALGLPAFVLQKVLQPVFFAREDTRTPLKYALVSLAVNAAVAIGLAPVIGFAAAALGTTVASWAMVLLLWLGVRRMGEVARLDDRARRRVWRIFVAAAGMGVVIWVTNIVLTPLFGLGLSVLAVAILVGLGILSYFGLCQMIGAVRLAELRAALRRG
ncbi:murein biosynthesis integral membrane protein MurJ [Jannaschia seohaensis]|uniref:Probable lipid II flippase MurJ n=1 Tax=Jannaschia seohaensis TaxID=475081 RepID=A0A2Y9AVX2_9RHOB|nr:murein biosynthesis integral membrane protein MurJ [Jannaschia seohaensis]PWJ17425.1 putative peptidoglycan lipid II flippase [Jannaschia seohaensis]SSA47488.1 putative peptidoglycan lipid II flippase [Jannaschia seohaensis]